MWHVWVKSFRQRNNLTQDAAADMLGIDVRPFVGGNQAATRPARM